MVAFRHEWELRDYEPHTIAYFCIHCGEMKCRNHSSMVEHATYIRSVEGSSPSGSTETKTVGS